MERKKRGKENSHTKISTKKKGEGGRKKREKRNGLRLYDYNKEKRDPIRKQDGSPPRNEPDWKTRSKGEGATLRPIDTQFPQRRRAGSVPKGKTDHGDDFKQKLKCKIGRKKEDTRKTWVNEKENESQRVNGQKNKK